MRHSNVHACVSHALCFPSNAGLNQKFLMFVKISLCRSLAFSGALWRSLADSGVVRRFFALCGNLSRSLAFPGDFWRLPALWRWLALSDALWFSPVLADFLWCSSAVITNILISVFYVYGSRPTVFVFMQEKHRRISADSPEFSECLNAAIETLFPSFISHNFCFCGFHVPSFYKVSY